MRDGKIAIEIDLKKALIVFAMAASVFLACICGEAEVLFLIIPSGLYGLFSRQI